MALFSNSSGFTKTKGVLKVRNRHLIPESTIRGKRILESAVEEEKSALDWYASTVEYWTRLRSGRLCSCQTEAIVTEEVERKNEGGLSLRDFIKSNDLSLPVKDFCPICYGNKYVGGYNRYGVNTVVLDFTSTPRASSIQLIRQTPHWYKPTNKTGTITWQFYVPKYFIAIGDISIRWHERPTNWSLKLDGNDFSKQLLDSSKGQKVSLSLDMRDSTNENAGVYAIFIQFIVTDPSVKVDMPRQTINYGQGDWGTIDSVQSDITVNVGSQIESPHTTDMMIDKNGIIWRVLEAEKGNPFGLTIYNTYQCRRVRDFEHYYILPSMAINQVYNKDNKLTFIE